MNFKKTATMLLATVMLGSFLTGCTSSTANSNVDAEQAAIDRATMEVQLNDYRGGVTRADYLKNFVLGAMEEMKGNNVVLRTDNPNSFWTTDGYQDFVVNFLSNAIINDSQWFNEEETNWDDIITQMSTTANSFTEFNEEGYRLKASVTILHNEKDDYSVKGVPVTAMRFGTLNVDFTGTAEYRCLYDCDKDWCKAYATLALNNEYMKDITIDLFEYARLDDNTFAIQTPRERLLIILKPVESDTDFREREIKEFYYSKLTQDGMRTKYVPYEPLAEYDMETGAYNQEASVANKAFQTYRIVNEKGDVATVYGKNDSMFLTDNIAKSLTTDWVFEERSLQQAICYKDKCLVVTTYNKLSEQYERFTYAVESITDADIKALEKLVEIEGLVGEQEVPDIEIPDVDPNDFANKDKNKDKSDDEGATDESSEGGEDTDIPLDTKVDEDLDSIRDDVNGRRDGDDVVVDGVT